MIAFAIPGVSSIASGILAGIVAGAGIIWYVIKRLNQAEADKLEAVSGKNYIKADEEAKAAQVTEAAAIKDAQKNVDAAPNNDF